MMFRWDAFLFGEVANFFPPPFSCTPRTPVPFPEGGAASRGQSSLWSNKPQCPSAVTGTLCCRRCRLSDETLNRGP
uniref:Uncharacterized protein n=1 Tax=Anguilla anguilla TaxID=7936 RepID=A0A0E9RVM9_ANGAN